METKYYSEFSKQREDLRKEWNGMNTDWEIYLQEANLRALKVSDALNVNIENYSHSEITETYNSLYNKIIKKIEKMNTENNRIIAEFMGLKPVEVFGSYSISKDHVSVNCENSNDAMNSFCKSTKYHSDWNWLMEVVEKIENIRHSKDSNSMRFDFQIKHHSAWINDWEIEVKKFIYCGGYHSKILATYDAALSFIKWYNENGTKNES